MFCNYCGKPNPDEASFCGACGRPLRQPRGAAPDQPSSPSPQPVSPAAAPTPAIQYGRPFDRANAVRVAVPVAAPAAVTSASEAPKKSKFGIGWMVAVTLPIALVLTFPYRDGKTICEATRHSVNAQVPYSIDILAARHPIKVGLLRSALNGNGVVDRFAENYLANEMSSRDPGTLECYISYYAILFNKDRFRQSIADWFEKQFHLN